MEKRSQSKSGHIFALTALCDEIAIIDGTLVTLKGNRVKFLASDVFLPNADELRANFPDAEELEGTVVKLSDSGKNPDAFAVIEILRTQQVVVPVERLTLTETGQFKGEDSTHNSSGDKAKINPE